MVWIDEFEIERKYQKQGLGKEWNSIILDGTIPEILSECLRRTITLHMVKEKVTGG